MGDLECAILRIVERQNLVFCLLNQHAEPHRQIGSDHLGTRNKFQFVVPFGFVCFTYMHQTESGEDFVTINFNLLKGDERKEKVVSLDHHRAARDNLSPKLYSINQRERCATSDVK
jgi:hypothetical protein